MDLPLEPPVAPMLGRLARELPEGDFLYEPKWDGFRCLAFRSGDRVELRSRNDRPLGRYFPELVAGLRAIACPQFVVDGEIVVASESGFEFDRLLARLHPAPSRVERLRAETPASLVMFDLLAAHDQDLREVPFAERRALLARLLGAAAAPIHLTPATDDLAVAAAWLDRFQGGGVDGVMAKHRELRYESGARAMVKVKRQQTADCVVAGFRLLAGRPLPSSLLLGLYDEDGGLRHVGVASAFSERRRLELLRELAPLEVPLEAHPWERGFLLEGSAMGRLRGAAARWSPQEMELDWVPLAPLRVCEISYDSLDVDRLRHPARFGRWRPDRDPASCRLDQLEVSAHGPGELLGAR